jgi:hypothetical protein
MPEKNLPPLSTIADCGLRIADWPLKPLFLVLVFFFLPALAPAAEEPAPPAPLLPRLMAALDGEPLAALSAADLRALPEKFQPSNLCKMLLDPEYKGGPVLAQLIAKSLGLDLGQLWPELKQQLSGPAVLALLPPEKNSQNQALRLVLAVLAPDQAAAERLKTFWSRNLIGATPPWPELKFFPVTLAALPQAQPAVQNGKPAGDILLSLRPGKLAAALKQAFAPEELQDLEAALPVFPLAGLEDIEGLDWGVTLSGEFFTEECRLDVIKDKKCPLVGLAKTLREEPGPWNELQAALPASQDLTVLLQADLANLGEDLPFAAQALERYLRGKRFARTLGAMTESLDPQRFKFIFDLLAGSFGLTGGASLTGDLNFIVAGALKTQEVATVREELAAGLKETGGDFETSQKAPKINGSAPLACAYQGRGFFGAPVIGLSSGWAWLCSNSGAYDELASALKKGRTELKAAERRTALRRPDEWPAGEALRLQLNLEKIVPQLYLVWLLTGQNKISIGSWKAPPELLPMPTLFNGRLGSLRTGIRRQNESLKISSKAVFPGVSLILAGALRELALQIEKSRQFALSGGQVQTEKRIPPASTQAGKAAAAGVER